MTFFVIGFVLLARVPVARAIHGAGYAAPGRIQVRPDLAEGAGFSAGGERAVVYAFGLPGVPLLRVKDAETLGDISFQM